MACAGIGCGGLSGGDLPVVVHSSVVEYQPISCAQHERLEFSVLRKIPLLIEYRDGVEDVRHVVLPLDVATRNRAEWLKFRKVGGVEVTEIRLDAIIAFSEAQYP